MGKATPLTDDERDRIIELIRSGLSRRTIAKETGRSTTTITRVAAEIGHDWLSAADARTQSSLARAHEARSAFSAERRAELAATATLRAQEMLEGWAKPYLVFNFGGKDNDYNEHTLDEPPIEAKRAMAQTFRDLMRTVIEIDRHDNRADEGIAAVDQWLRDMLGEAAA